ncbi:hypothetical protein HHK36_013524 [Tetracentron sinense]|uniref:Clp R domain-containing protein n=1 Tax=Tetracentron sinense TaxID=13715 RepID=A0A834Z6G0_TETSI|nr:hypothetical protein HHK36_013524 [Tetracentron sinense]
MRAGACTLQQTLTSEAASVLKHSLHLARRRGHAQVTPLHVAATLLSSGASVLRRACLKSQPHQTSHPLQCRALELCFNVALNRLPTTPAPLLHGHPSLSNALIAALKRAQAHQRRGCIEQQQQQPLLAIKVELEQLIISILDDPSVSRVMREAGFSSTSVKNNLEDSSASSVFHCYGNSGGVFSSPCSPSPSETHRESINHSSFWHTHFLNFSSEQNPVLFPTRTKHLGTPITDSATEKEDFKLVLEVLLGKKRRNTVVVGDSVSATGALVAELMKKVEIGEVPDELRSASFIKFQFPSVSLRFMKKEDVEMKVVELRRKVDSLVLGGRGAIIYAGDLIWVVEASTPNERDGGFSVSGYSPVDHLVAEIGRLLSDYSCSNRKVWLMATANFQTYMRCQMKQPPLEIQWGIQAVSVPSGGLDLSLHASSVLDSRMTLSTNPSPMLEAKPFTSKEEQDKLTCCGECTSNFEREAKLFKTGQQKPSPLLPSWLYGADTHQKDDLVELRRKWNRLCHSLHRPRPNQVHTSSSFYNRSLSSKSYTNTPSYPWWPTRLQFNQNDNFHDSNSVSFTESPSKPNFASQFGTHQPCSIEFGFSNGIQKIRSADLSLDSFKNTENKEEKITLALGNSRSSDSVTSLDQSRTRTMEQQDLSKLLQENIPWQSETIPSIVEALSNSKSTTKNGTWLLIQGNDWIGKRRLALGIASSDHLIHMNMRRRENEATPCSKLLTEALKTNEKCVVLIEDISYADIEFKKFLADCFETRNFKNPIRKECNFEQAIFILTVGDSPSHDSRDRNQDSVIQMKFLVKDTIPSSGATSFDHKRKAEWELSNRTKNPRTDEKEGASSVADENRSSKREFSRQLSSNIFDLNIQAEDVEGEEKPDETNSITSDLTLETAKDPQIPHGFLESIENRYIFDQNPAQLSQMKESFLSKIKGSFEERCGSERVVCFSVDQVVLEEMVIGCGSFLNSLFEKWLKDVFQSSLESFKKGGIQETVKLCFGGKGESNLEFGFLGSSLPKTIQVAFKD